MRSVVITGTSTGIGRAASEALIDHGFRVFGSVRKEADAARLAAELGPRFVPLVFDMTDESAVRAAAGEVRAALGGETLAGLVNNAGIAVAGPLLALPLADIRRQIEVNLIGTVTVTQAFAPLLGVEAQLAGARGRIVNIGSVSGRIAAPFVGAYSASKFAVEGLSDSLRRELLPFGINVVVIAPGAVRTPLWSKADQADVTPYLATPYGPALQCFRAVALAEEKRGLPPERIGRAVLHALTTRRPKARYLVSPQPLQYYLARSLPARLLDRLVGRRLGLRPGRR